MLSRTIYKPAILQNKQNQKTKDYMRGFMMKSIFETLNITGQPVSVGTQYLFRLVRRYVIYDTSLFSQMWTQCHSPILSVVYVGTWTQVFTTEDVSKPCSKRLQDVSACVCKLKSKYNFTFT